MKRCCILILAVLLALQLCACGLPSMDKFPYKDAEDLSYELWDESNVKGKGAGVNAVAVHEMDGQLIVETGTEVIIRIDSSKPVEAGDYFRFRITNVEEKNWIYIVDGRVLDVEKNSPKGRLNREQTILIDVLETGVTDLGNDACVYGTILRNNTEHTLLMYSEPQITVRDKDHFILAMDHDFLTRLYPGECAAVGDIAYLDSDAAAVYADVFIPEIEDYLRYGVETMEAYIPLRSEVLEISEGSTSAVIRITNENDYTVDAELGIAFRDEAGKLLGCDKTYPGEIAPNSFLDYTLWVRPELLPYLAELYVLNSNSIS